MTAMIAILAAGLGTYFSRAVFIIALAVAGLVAWRSRNHLLTIVLTMTAFWVLRAVGLGPAPSGGGPLPGGVAGKPISTTIQAYPYFSHGYCFRSMTLPSACESLKSST